MKIRQSKTAPRSPMRLTALMTTAFLCFTGVIAASPVHADEANGNVSLPETIPSLSDWEEENGAYQLSPATRVIYDATQPDTEGIASILQAELNEIVPGVETASSPVEVGDIEIEVDPARTDLGAEGYELIIDDSVTITGAAYAGAFYGTRTLLQMVTQQQVLPHGSTIDIPQYEERGVTLCACVINISPEFIDRLIEEMAYLKLNTLMVELKVKVENYPQTNTWSYYTKDDIRALVAKAAERGIDVIPEINSPGHMEIWLENLPELQLTNQNTGKKDEVRMDITKDESFDFYASLIDEYSEVFTSKYWHMGMDEYMLGSGYSNYPQIKQFAQQKWGPQATEDDVVAWYANKINAYVKSKGKTMRVWNDGIIRNSQIVRFDTDIVVEHWNNAASSVAPQTFVDWGHEVVNVSNSLYMVRGSYGVNTTNLYNGSWGINTFYNGAITQGQDQVRGARISMWPDGGTPQEAENLTEERMFEPLRFIAQMTWSNTKPWSTYSSFKAAMDTVGRPPLWDSIDRQPLPEGAYKVSASEGSLAADETGAIVLSDEAETFTFEKAPHAYYYIKNGAGQCLEVSRAGTVRLNVPVEIGAEVVYAPCGTTTLQHWQIRSIDSGYTIANAASQQYLSISEGLTNVPVANEGFKNVADGLVVQTPSDWGKTVWSVTGGVALSTDPQSATVQFGKSSAVNVTITNTSANVLSDSVLSVESVPRGWTVTPRSVSITGLGVKQKRNVEFTLTNVSGTGEAASVEFVLSGSDEQVLARSETTVNAVCSANTIRPVGIASVSTQQLTGEPAPNGPAAAAIDGDPATYWHSQWSPSDAPYPHSIVVELADPLQICGLWYTGRASAGTGGANGRIARYEVYASESVSTVNGAWGDPIASGTFANVAEPQLAGFEPQDAKFVKLVALSEVNGNPWATIGELSVAGPFEEPPAYTPSISLDNASLTAPGAVMVSGEGFAPNERVDIEVTPRAGGAAVASLQTYADVRGAVQVSVDIPVTATSKQYVVSALGWASSGASSAGLDVAIPANATVTKIAAGSSVAGSKTKIDVDVSSAAGGTPSGAVKIFEGTKTIATVSLVNGRGAVSVNLSVGTHKLVGKFTPTNAAQFLPSESSVLSVKTAKVTPTITAKLSASKKTVGKTASVAVTVKSGNLKPSGTVSLKLSGKTLDSKKLSASGKATLKVPALTVGSHKLSVTYTGSAEIAQSTTKLPTFTVTKAKPSVKVTVNKKGTQVTVKLKGVKTPSGKVVLKVDGKKIAKKALKKSSVSFKVKKLKKGKHTFSVSYGGDKNNKSLTKKTTLRIK